MYQSVIDRIRYNNENDFKEYHSKLQRMMQTRHTNIFRVLKIIINLIIEGGNNNLITQLKLKSCP